MKPDAPKSKEKHAPAAPDRVAGLSRRAQFMILFFVAAVVAWAWFIGPFRATKEEASPETAALRGRQLHADAPAMGVDADGDSQGDGVSAAAPG